ncbi:MAG TPA: hypothetical protein PK829_03475 [Promineifilum sp.]|nr:hypothetical protein [Promineifilum sp.]HQF71480.1 hypothetical protein [Promineifilum sp.]
MDTSSNLSMFLIGLAIGAAVALLGGVVDFALHLRGRREPSFGVPGCLVYTAGGLILAGVIALIVSFVATGSLAPALAMGGGVLLGFYGGFILLVALWFVRDRGPARAEEQLTSDSSLP